MAHTISYSDFENTTTKVVLASASGVAETHKKLTMVIEFEEEGHVSHYYVVSKLDDIYTTLHFYMAIAHYNKI